MNQPPVVGAGDDLMATLPSSAALGGEVVDDGLPGGALAVSWSQVSGPGAATFADPRAVQATASFLGGSYVLRLEASDGALSSSDEMAVTVEPALDASVPDLTLPSQ